MQEQPKLITKNFPTSDFAIWIIVSSIFISLGCMVISMGFRGPYFDITLGGVGCLAFVLPTGLTIRSLRRFDKLYFYSDRVRIDSAFGFTRKTYLFSELTGWSEHEEKDRNKKWNRLTIYTSLESHRVVDSYFLGYNRIKELLTKDLPEREFDSRSEKRRTTIFLAIVSYLFAAILILPTIHWWENWRKIPNKSDNVQFEGVLGMSPIISTGKNSRITIPLKSHNPFQFQIWSTAYEATHVKRLENGLRDGDTVTVTISKENYLSKVAKQKQPDFWTKHMGYTDIAVVGLSSKTEVYLSVDDFNRADKEDSKIGVWVFTLLLIGATGFGIFNMWRAKKMEQPN